MGAFKAIVSAVLLQALLICGAGAKRPGWFGGRPKGGAEVLEAALLTDAPNVAPKAEQSEAKTAEEKTFVKTTFKARRTQSRKIQMCEKDMLEFFMSEASRESILNANNFEQIGPNVFRCEMEPIQFFSASIVPVLDIRVDVDPIKGTALIHAVSGKVKKSAAPAANADAGFTHKGEINETSFHMNTLNFVSWTPVDDKTLQLTADLSMEISMQKPAWLIVPNGVMNRMGSMVLRQVLKKTLPEFLDRIGQGYVQWAREGGTIA